jgi:hypothetical protein
VSNPLLPAFSSGEDGDGDLGIALIAVIVIAAVSVFAIMILIVLTIKKRRYRRNRMSPFNAKHAPPAPTLDHLRALEPWMSPGPGSLSGSDESSKFSNKAPSSVPSKRSHSSKSAVSASLYESNGTVSLMKDPVPTVSQHQHQFTEDHVIDLSDQGSVV